MAWPGKKTHTAAIRSTLCECSSERERNVCFWSTTLFVCLSPLDCMTCVSISGVVFTTGTQFHSQNFLPRGALSLRRSVYTRIFMYVRAQVLSPSAASPHCGLSPNRVSFLFIHCGCEDPPPNHHHHLHLFTHLLPFSFLSCFHSPNYPYSSKWPLLQSL